MGDVVKAFWFKSDDQIINLTKTMGSDELVEKIWFKPSKIVRLIKFGKAYQLEIKTGGLDTNDFDSKEVDFKSKKDLDEFLKELIKK